MAVDTKNNMKLFGKELDDELAKRKKLKDARIAERITSHNAARSKGMDILEFMTWENGYDCCSHEEWKDTSDFHFKFIFKVCKKCGMVKQDSTERVEDDNMERAFGVYKEVVASKISEKDKSNLAEK